eukprot:3452180-Prymnesium_polylepis.1
MRSANTSLLSHTASRKPHATRADIKASGAMEPSSPNLPMQLATLSAMAARHLEAAFATASLSSAAERLRTRLPPPR